MSGKFDDIRIDDNGDQRCWNCGGKQFTLKRSKRAKAGLGAAALLAAKHNKCQSCGVYNILGNAKKFTGSQKDHDAVALQPPPPSEVPGHGPNDPVWVYERNRLGMGFWRCIEHGNAKVFPQCSECTSHTPLPTILSSKSGDQYPSEKHPRKRSAALSRKARNVAKLQEAIDKNASDMAGQ